MVDKLMKVLLLALAFAPARGGTAGGTDANGAAQVERYLEKASRNGFCGSVLVAEGGTVIIEKGYGLSDREKERPETAGTGFSVGSITKQFTAAAIMRLEASGRLFLTDSLPKYFPEAKLDKRGITILELLTHTAGLPDAIGDDYDTVDAGGFARLALGSSLVNSPGKEYRYSNVGYSLLGIIVEKVSGIPYERFLHDSLFIPAGMRRTGYLLAGFTRDDLATGYRDGKRWGTALERPWLADGPGWHLRANGGILSTVGDMYRWYLALKHHTVLPEESVRDMFTPYVPEDPDSVTSYGFGWVIEKKPAGEFIWHNGGNGVYNAYVGFDLARDLFIAVSSNSNDKISDRIALQIYTMLSGPYDAVDQAVAERYDGLYRLSSGGKFRVFIDENDDLLASTEEKDAALILLSDGSERPAEIQKTEDRTLEMMRMSLKGDYGAYAEAAGMPPEQAGKEAGSFWEEAVKEYGHVKDISSLATVARANRNMVLAFLRIAFEKAHRYVMCVWREGKLRDIQQMGVPKKVFGHKQGGVFSTPTNGLEVSFGNGPGGGPVLTIRDRKGQVSEATRAGD